MSLVSSVDERTSFSLYSSGTGWGVFNGESGGCPDLVSFPKYCYRKYNVPDEKFEDAWNKLLIMKGELERGGIIPTQETADKIFKDLV